MNRLSDLQSTLRQNLEDNRAQQGSIEFIIVCFDKTTTTADWIHTNFAEELESRYLCFHQSDDLDSWHFGKAKNSFRGLTRGRIYASLDGDNFTGPGGAKHIIETFESNDYDCIFHQFQGDWGDGTCGRVSMTVQDYEDIGYDNDLLPRQWDELDAILSILVQRRSRRYVCYSGKSILEKSRPFARFIRENALEVRTVELDGNLDPLSSVSFGSAVGQHSSSYVKDDEALKYSSLFNHLCSFLKNTHSDKLRTQYVGDLVNAQRAMSERLDPRVLLSWLLTPERDDSPNLARGDVALVACIRNEEHLEGWLEHYRTLGVTHFLLVDDGSTVPIGIRAEAHDVWVWRPKCGQFRHAKAFWLEVLLRVYARDRWVITADGDEYLELPKTPCEDEENLVARRPLQQLICWAQKQGIRYFPGILFDLAPGKDALPALRRQQTLDQSDFTHYQFRPANPSAAYLNHNTVRWSYGEYAPWAYRVDLRFRLNRSFDSLRKFPLFRMDTDVHLNQGFHDLILDGAKRSASDFGRPDLLVIRHFKLLNMQRSLDSEELRPCHAYHEDTQISVSRLRQNIVNALRAGCLSPFTYTFLNHSMTPVPGRFKVTLRAAQQAYSQPACIGLVVSRRADILVTIADTSPRICGEIIQARSLDEAAEWVMRKTPFSSISEKGEGYVSLSMNRAGLSAGRYTRSAHNARDS
jgi:hypothetical protein